MSYNYPDDKKFKKFNTLLSEMRCASLLDHIDMINTDMLEEYNARQNGGYQVFRVKGIETPSWFCSEHSQDYLEDKGATVTIIEIPFKVFKNICEKYNHALDSYCDDGGVYIDNWSIEGDILYDNGISNEGYSRWRQVQNT